MDGGTRACNAKYGPCVGQSQRWGLEIFDQEDEGKKGKSSLLRKPLSTPMGKTGNGGGSDLAGKEENHHKKMAGNCRSHAQAKLKEKLMCYRGQTG